MNASLANWLVINCNILHFAFYNGNSWSGCTSGKAPVGNVNVAFFWRKNAHSRASDTSKWGLLCPWPSSVCLSVSLLIKPQPAALQTHKQCLMPIKIKINISIKQKKVGIKELLLRVVSRQHTNQCTCCLTLQSSPTLTNRQKKRVLEINLTIETFNGLQAWCFCQLAEFDPWDAFPLQWEPLRQGGSRHHHELFSQRQRQQRRFASCRPQLVAALAASCARDPSSSTRFDFSPLAG